MAVPSKRFHLKSNEFAITWLGDLHRLVRLKAGGNYLPIALITCACDAFANLKYEMNIEGTSSLQTSRHLNGKLLPVLFIG